MVLSYYIATQTFEEHLKFKFVISVFVYFFWLWFFVLFLKNKMQHIPVVSHVLSGGTFHLEIVVPATQTCGSYHRRDDDFVFIYSGRGASRDRGSAGVRWGQKMLRFPIDFKGEGGWGGRCRLFRALQRYLASLMGTAVLGSVNPCRVSALGTVQRVGGPTLALYIQWVEPCLLVFTLAHLTRRDGATSARMPLTTPPSTPPDSASKLPFIMRFCPGGRTDGQQHGDFIS